MTDEKDRKASRRHAIFFMLVQHTGEILTPDLVDKMTEELMKEIHDGPCSWAFKGEDA